MALEPEAQVRVARLRAELAIDLAALVARAEETATIVKGWAPGATPTRPELVLVAVNLHGWYTAFETALERVARLLDLTVPEGASWRTDLLAQMAVEVPGLRPALVPSSIVQPLHELRRFRHFFRNAYALDLDASRLTARAADLAAVHPTAHGALNALLRNLAAAVD